MTPETHLPFDRSFKSTEEYIERLFDYAASNELFKALSGGVHILGFFTVQPEIYASTLPSSWRHWFLLHDVATILDLLLREDRSSLEMLRGSGGESASTLPMWRGHQPPPKSLLEFIISTRKLSLKRSFESGAFGDPASKPPHSLVVGMRPKKIHETQHFAKYIGSLRTYIGHRYEHQISHVVDFGSGQNYLGRTLASPPHNERIVAIERKQHNIGGAQAMDVQAKLVKKPKLIRNKKAFREQSRLISSAKAEHDFDPLVTKGQFVTYKTMAEGEAMVSSKLNQPIVYVERDIEDGDLSYLDLVLPLSTSSSSVGAQFLVISLHSCGDLLHHGLRSLVLNEQVKAVAMIGCCYHLNSDRLGPPTWKPPHTRRQQLPNGNEEQGSPNGFPLSERLLTYRHRNGNGIRLNITARMMASQAAENWTDQDCESFFKRHFYRALLQKIFLDRGVFAWPGDGDCRRQMDTDELASSADLPITIGSLRKSCYTSFIAYVRGAMAKLSHDQTHESCIRSKMDSLTDEAISAYEEQYHTRKKELSIMWSLMAFVAGVTESVILVDRFLYLHEQPEIDQCWVEPVFDYEQSPRNLVVVGIKH